jgi:dynein heavy chain, axonemal
VQGNILDDEELINTLSQSKATSNTIAAKVSEAETTEAQIDATRERYRPVSARASLLFFCISDLATVDPMYQYSLSWFSALFVRAMQEAPKFDDIGERGRALSDTFTLSLYVNVCQSLFERHKLLLSFLLTVAILKASGCIDELEWRFMLTGPTRTGFEERNPAPDWVTDKIWMEVLNVALLPAFRGFDRHFATNISHYKVQRQVAFAWLLSALCMGLMTRLWLVYRRSTYWY